LPRFRTGAVVAIALAAGFVAWLVLRPGSNAKPLPQATPAHASPKIVAPGRLRALASTLGYPLYWVGKRAATRYELTRTAGGNTFIRYLPPQARAGDGRPAFLAIGTYPVRDPYGQIDAAARRPGAVSLRLPLGGVAVYDRATPTSVYFAYPGSKVQVEVYDPSGRTARRLVLTGQVVPIK